MKSGLKDKSDLWDTDDQQTVATYAAMKSGLKDAVWQDMMQRRLSSNLCRDEKRTESVSFVRWHPLYQL